MRCLVKQVKRSVLGEQDLFFPAPLQAKGFDSGREAVSQTHKNLITSDSASNDVSVIENIEPSPAPPAPPGPGGAAPFVRQEPAPSSLAPSDLDALLLALGGADRKPTTLVGPSDVRTNLDKWQALVRRHRVDDNEMFSALLWEEDYMIVRDSEAH